MSSEGRRQSAQKCPQSPCASSRELSPGKGEGCTGWKSKPVTLGREKVLEPLHPAAQGELGAELRAQRCRDRTATSASAAPFLQPTWSTFAPTAAWISPPGSAYSRWGQFFPAGSPSMSAGGGGTALTRPAWILEHLSLWPGVGTLTGTAWDGCPLTYR